MLYFRKKKIKCRPSSFKLLLSSQLKQFIYKLTFTQRSNQKSQCFSTWVQKAFSPLSTCFSPEFLGTGDYVPTQLFGMKHPNPVAYRPGLGACELRCQLQQYSHHWIFPSMSVTSVCPHGEPHPPLTFAGNPLRRADRYSSGFYQITAFSLALVYVRFCVQPLRVRSLFPPVLLSSCN